jgi:hypothetical protein
MSRIDSVTWTLIAAAAATGFGALALAQGRAAAGGPAGGPAARTGSAAVMAAAMMTRVCLPAVSRTGHGKLQSGAEISARMNWNRDRSDDYDKFDDSDGHDMTCHHDGRPPARRQWTCVATAQQCKKDALGAGTLPATAPLCQSPLAAVGADAKFQTPAQNFAVKAWQDAARAKFGPDYQAWGIAKSPDISCRNNGLGALRRRWTCVATATPCRQDLSARPGGRFRGGLGG